MTLHCLHMVNILNNACSLLLRHLIPDASNCFDMSQITGIPQGTIKAGLVRSHVECYWNQTQMTQIAESSQNIHILIIKSLTDAVFKSRWNDNV